MIHKLINGIEKLITGEARPPNKSNLQVDKEKVIPPTLEVTNQTSSFGNQNEQQQKKEIKTPKQIVVFRTVLLLVVAGVLVIIFANLLEVDNMLVKSATSPPLGESNSNIHSQLPSKDSPFIALETALEQRTKDILEKMIGVGSVNVLITVDSTEEQIVELNTNESKSVTKETDKNGGVREITTTSNDGQVVFLETGGEQGPVVTKVINPRIRGVLIVAEGAEDATVRKLIIQAVEKGLNVHQSKISVVPSKI